VLYFNKEESDWIADDSSQDIESIFHKHPVIHIPERRLDYISPTVILWAAHLKKSWTKRPEATERAINYIFLF